MVRALLPFLLIPFFALAQSAPRSNTSTSTRTASILAPTGSSLTLKGTAVDGAAAVGVIIDNTATLSSGKMLSIRTGGVEVFQFYSDKSFLPAADNTGNIGTANKRFFNIWGTNYKSADGISRINLNSGTFTTVIGSTADGASAYGVKLGNSNALSTAGSKIVGFFSDNVTTEVASIDRLGKLSMQASDSSGTPGAATINKPSGQASIAAGASSVVITNSTVTTASIIIVPLQATDATCTSVKSVVPASGSFTVNVNANCTAATKLGFVVHN